MHIPLKHNIHIRDVAKYRFYGMHRFCKCGDGHNICFPKSTFRTLIFGSEKCSPSKGVSDLNKY